MHATRRHGVSIVTAALAALAALALAAPASPARAAEEEETPALYQRFEIAAGGAWANVSLDLVPGAWRIGAPDGPPADGAQIERALARLGVLRVRGRCTGSVVVAVQGTTEYPCGFALARLEIDGIAAERLQGIGGGEAPTFSIRGPQGALAAEASQADVRGRPGEHAVDVVVGIAQGFGARAGGQIRFAFRAVPNATVPSRFDPAGGLVVVEPARRKGRPGAADSEREV